MPTFAIHVTKTGYVEIDAKTLDEATQKAASLPDEAFAWEHREFSDCEQI